VKTRLFAFVAASSFLVPLCSIADTRAVPDTMLAAALDMGGGPEVLTLHHLPVPKPAAGVVLIAVSGAGLGVWEQNYRQHPGANAHFPVILGSEGAGIVAAVGANVHGFKVGDQVYGTGSAFDAEYATLSAQHVAHVPKGISLAQAGILAISGLSALQGLDDVLGLKPGQTLIIHGAAGGVGTLAVQFAKLRGVKVLATASTDEGLALVSRLGADVVVNGRSGDIAAAAKRFAPDGVDAVLGLAAGDSLERCIDALRSARLGRVAYLYGMEPLPKPRWGVRMTLYSFTAGPAELAQLNKAVEAAKVQVPIAAEYPLSDVAGAHTALKGGHLLGKILIRVQ
jgi:NADPH:quinone reductase-like Zn-dependent oxidoreductase